MPAARNQIVMYLLGGSVFYEGMDDKTGNPLWALLGILLFPFALAGFLSLFGFGDNGALFALLFVTGPALWYCWDRFFHPRLGRREQRQPAGRV